MTQYCDYMAAMDWPGLECDYVLYGSIDWISHSEWMVPGTWAVTD